MFHHKFKEHPLAVIFLTVFVDLLGVGILIPVIPQLLANPRSEYFMLPTGFNLKEGFILLGYLSASFSIMQFLATPVLGQLSDRYGRRRLLAISLFGTCISYLIFAVGIITKNIPLLFAARMFDGITGGNIAVAQAAIADVSTPQNRAKNFGMIGAAFGLGFVIGPYIGGKLSDPTVISWFTATTPFYFAAILSAINVASILLFFPETLTEKSHALKVKWTRSVLNIYHAATHKTLREIFLTIFLFNGGFTFFTTFFSVYLIQKFNFTQGNIGDFFAYIGIWVAFSQAVIVRQLAKRFSEKTLIRFGLIGTGSAIFLYFLPNQVWQLLLIVPIMAISNGLTFANLTALISKSVGPKVQGEVMGINSSVAALAMSVPPILSGYIAADLSPNVSIWLGGAIILIGAALFWLSYHPQKVEVDDIE